MKSIGLHLCAAVSLAVVLGSCGGRQQTEETRQRETLRFGLARTYVAKGALNAAIPLLRKELAEHPNAVAVRLLYASVLRDLGLYSQSQSQFERTLALAPNSAAIHAGFGILCDLQEQRERALKHHRRAVALASNVAKYHNNLGFSLYLDNKNDAAIHQLEIALEQDPAMSIAYNNIGFAYGRKGDFAKAEKSFQVVRSRAATLFNMSIVHEEHGEHERANSLREQAYKLDETLRPEKREKEQSE